MKVLSLLSGVVASALAALWRAGLRRRCRSDIARRSSVPTLAGLVSTR